MKYRTALFLLLMPILINTSVMAKQLPLIDSCVELVNIYDSRNEQKFLAAQTTSLSEGLRAGYCLGVLQENAKNEYRCSNDWFKRAKFIAAQQGFKRPFSENKLLDKSCEQ
ncbi:hypothetical protein CXF72_13335 [Psychromonas sp. MB-3u-54]|uniref:hypothetical protein n=1 Tax=Psychromonas sp. MB-3u-54 TaxID=2058319 RepID=UPI000C342CAF|nr:hypothetical protein [Psychromonas sp. MB-3u-54]PKH02094.1 hypothetical protein CXF72_13335 [Psychromonas sp. MB-3u-54]